MKKDSRATQGGRILAILSAGRGEWVLLPQISACAAQYSARICELRYLGFRIANKAKDVDRVRHSWFRLASSPVQTSAAMPSASAAERVRESLPLFTEGEQA